MACKALVATQYVHFATLEVVSWDKETCRREYIHVTFQLVDYPRSEYLGLLVESSGTLFLHSSAFPGLDSAVVCLPPLLEKITFPFFSRVQQPLVIGLLHPPLDTHPEEVIGPVCQSNLTLPPMPLLLSLCFSKTFTYQSSPLLLCSSTFASPCGSGRDFLLPPLPARTILGISLVPCLGTTHIFSAFWTWNVHQ